MERALLIIMIIVAVLLVLAVVAQPAKDSSNANLTGAADFGSQKRARGFEAVMDRIISVLGLAFMVLALIMAKISS